LQNNFVLLMLLTQLFIFFSSIVFNLRKKYEVFTIGDISFY
jgi:hypothetical protein